MALNTTATTVAQRLARFSGEIIKGTMVQEVLCKTGRQVALPKNKSKLYTARTYVPYGAGTTAATRNIRFTTVNNGASQAQVDRSAAVANAHKSVDGVSSTSDIITPIDYTAVMQAYECSFSWSREITDYYEDDIPQIAKDLVTDRVSFVNETIVHAALKGCTNQFFGGAGTTMATVNAEITLNFLRKIAKSLLANSAKPVTKMLKSSPSVLTTPVAPSFFVYIPTDLVSDLRLLSATTGPNGFWPAETYADAVPGEVGKLEGFRFIASPFWPSYQDAGALIGGTNCASSSGTYLDVYPIVVVAQDAFCQIALRGLDAVDSTYIPSGEKTKTDIHGKRGYAGAYWYKSVLIENDKWMAVGFVANRTL